MQIEISPGEHEIIFQPVDTDNYYALRVKVNVTESSITCTLAEYGTYDPATKKWTKVGDSSCNACATEENGVCISDFNIHGYLKPIEVPPPPPTPDFDTWLQNKGGCTAISFADILEIIDGYKGVTDIGFTVSFTNILTTIDCYKGVITSLSGKTTSRRSIDEILNSLRKKEV